MLEEEEGVLLCCLYVLDPSAENIISKHGSEEIRPEEGSMSERIQEKKGKLT